METNQKRGSRARRKNLDDNTIKNPHNVLMKKKRDVPKGGVKKPGKPSRAGRVPSQVYKQGGSWGSFLL